MDVGVANDAVEQAFGCLDFGCLDVGCLDVGGLVGNVSNVYIFFTTGSPSDPLGILFL